MKALLLLALLPLSCLAEVSIYRGLATTHLFIDNSYLNNDNAVTILKLDDVLVGTMTNSYGEDGYFLGYQPKVYSTGRLEVYAGLTIVEGYKRWQLPYYRKLNDGNAFDKVISAFPVISASYSVTDSVAIQLNSMAGFILNAGVRLDF